MPLSTKEKVELLKRVPLFAECSKAELAEVAVSADEREAAAGDRLTEEGAREREFFILVEGTVAVRRSGKKLGDLGAGDWFGEMAILRYKPRAATVTATSPVRVLVINDRDFRQIVETTPRIALKVLRSVAQRLDDDARS